MKTFDTKVGAYSPGFMFHIFKSNSLGSNCLQACTSLLVVTMVTKLHVYVSRYCSSEWC